MRPGDTVAVAGTQEDHLPKGLGVVVEGRMESGECNSETFVFACWGCCHEAERVAVTAEMYCFTVRSL